MVKWDSCRKINQLEVIAFFKYPKKNLFSSHMTELPNLKRKRLLLLNTFKH